MRMLRMIQKTILIADDNAIVRETLSAILEDQGYSVWSAQDGEEALSIVKESSPDILILDVLMPKLSGYDVCRTMKNDPDLKKTFIIMLSAKDLVIDYERGKEVGADRYIAKPFNPSELLALVGQCP